MKRNIFLILALFVPSFLFGQLSETTDPDFKIIAPEYGSPIFEPNSRDPSDAAFTLLYLHDNDRIPIDWLIHSEMAFFPRRGEVIDNDPRSGYRYLFVKTRIDNSDGIEDLQSASMAGIDGGKKNWWAFMLMLRSDPNAGMIPKVIWFAEEGPHNFNRWPDGNRYLIVRSGESLILNIVWEIPIGIPLQDIAVQYVDVRGFYSNFIRLDRVRAK